MIFVHVHGVTCTVQVDILDPEEDPWNSKCPRFGIKRPGPLWANLQQEDVRRIPEPAEFACPPSSDKPTLTPPPHYHRYTVWWRNVPKKVKRKMLVKSFSFRKQITVYWCVHTYRTFSGTSLATGSFAFTRGNKHLSLSNADVRDDRKISTLIGFHRATSIFRYSSNTSTPAGEVKFCVIRVALLASLHWVWTHQQSFFF